jgi:hypothetical protein
LITPPTPHTPTEQDARTRPTPPEGPPRVFQQLLPHAVRVRARPSPPQPSAAPLRAPHYPGEHSHSVCRCGAGSSRAALHLQEPHSGQSGGFCEVVPAEVPRECVDTHTFSQLTCTHALPTFNKLNTSTLEIHHTHTVFLVVVVVCFYVNLLRAIILYRRPSIQFTDSFILHSTPHTHTDTRREPVLLTCPAGCRFSRYSPSCIGRLGTCRAVGRPFPRCTGGRSTSDCRE